MDTARIEELLKLMEDHDLAELEVESDGVHVKLKKQTGAQGLAQIVTAAPVHAMQPSLQTAAPAAAEADNAPDTQVKIIKSPMVGTFFRAASPDADTFVEVGDPVDEETLVCIVEAMKVMNEVRAEVVGTISKVLAENGKPVEFGQPLFEVTA